jgi:hypothetical protein
MCAESTTKGFRPVPDAIKDDIESLVGFVALIDVLGFRELIGRGDNHSTVRTYADTVTQCLEKEHFTQLQFVLFSDNLVINTRNENVEALTELARACSDILLALAGKLIAVRGAIAHGAFVRSLNTRQGVVLAGRPIVEADYYQHSQDWVGIMLAPSAVRRDIELLQAQCRPPVPSKRDSESEAEWLKRISLSLYLRSWPEIPFHADKAPDTYFDGYAVVPIAADATSRTNVKFSLAQMSRVLTTMKASAPTPESQRKYSETQKFLIHIEQEWR